MRFNTDGAAVGEVDLTDLMRQEEAAALEESDMEDSDAAEEEALYRELDGDGFEAEAGENSDYDMEADGDDEGAAEEEVESARRCAAAGVCGAGVPRGASRGQQQQTQRKQAVRSTAPPPLLRVLPSCRPPID